MNTERTLEWQFGGWAGLSPWLGGALLLLIACAGVALAIWFYRDTLRRLTWRQRLFFAALRSGFFLSLILCLAGPAWVERVYASDREARPLAVVVDRSPSMAVTDARGTTRLDHAVRTWKKVEPAARRAFPSLTYFRFSSALQSAPDFETAVTASDPGADTHLFEALDQVLKTAPAGGYGGVVCLTDGLDTTDNTPEEAARRALQSHSPLYFAVGQNRQAPHDSLLIRELAVPGQVLRKARFTATALIEAHAVVDRDVPVALWVNDKPASQYTLHLHAGTNLLPWPVAVEAGEAGLLHVSCRLGEGAEEEAIAAAVPVVAQDQIHILFYQGMLDWSYRFIHSALDGDSSFVLTGLFNPSLNMTQVVTSGEPGLAAMPDSVDGLKPFQVVVLSNAFANELTTAQQNALLDYVHGGGGLLFLVSDNVMARTFSGTALESVLPVVFEAPPKPGDHDDSVAQFQDMMHSIGGVNFSREDDFANDSQTQNSADPLKSFALPANARPSEIAGLFDAGAGGTLQHLPRFASYARVHSVKAGGEVLAVHPDDKTDANEARALLVTQRYGQGQVTALLTDALWRWRLSLPSTAHDPELFWQQLFLALSRNASGTAGMRFAVQPFSAALGETCAFQLDGVSGGGAPVLTAVSPLGQSQVITPQPGSQAGSWIFQVNPNAPGAWRIQAVGDRGAAAETLLRVSSASHAAELSGLPADMDGLRKLAESTGGSLLNDGPPENWAVTSAPSMPTLIGKHSHPLWNNWIVLFIGLGFYVTELIWRRRAKLL